MTTTGPALFEVVHLTKDFPRVRALDDVSLTVEAGEIHVVLGELGAGKTTLLRILGGLYPAGTYQGEIRCQGNPVVLRRPADAIQAGIGIVPRPLAVFDQLTVAENIVVGQWERRHPFFVRSAEIRRQAQATLERLHLRLPLEARVAQLDPGQKRLLLIARVFAGHPRLIVLDEPTTHLTTADMLSQLLHIIRRLAALQIACLYLTRRLNEALDIGDRVTILRDGQVVGVFQRQAFDESAMARAMLSQRPGDIPHHDDDEAMERPGLGRLLRRWLG